MYCPIESKKSKLESCCIICSIDSYSTDNDGELTSIFLNYLFPPADKEEITIKLLRLFTFCKNCGSILGELIELHKSLEYIQSSIRNTVKDIKCSILKNEDDGRIIDVNVRKFRKIATRDYCPKVVLRNADAFVSKGGPIENNAEFQVASNTDVHYSQLKRGSTIVKEPAKNGCQTSGDVFKSLNTNSCDNRRNSVETSQSNATTLSLSPTSFSTDSDTVDYNEEAVQPNPDYNQIANGQKFSGQQSLISSAEVIIPMESNFSFAEEEGTVKFEPWNQIKQEDQDGDNYLQHASQEQNVIIKDLQEIHSNDYNGSKTLQQSHNIIAKSHNILAESHNILAESHNILAESQTLSKKFPTLTAALNMSCGIQSLDPEDRAIKSILWTPPEILPPDNIVVQNTENFYKASVQKANENHSTLLWTPPPPDTLPLSQVKNTQIVSSQNLASHNNVTTHSASLWVPEGFPRIDTGNNPTSMSTDNMNQNYPAYCKSVIKRHIQQKEQRKAIQGVTVTDISPTKKYCTPPFTFAQMIFIAIVNSANHCATPDAIWESIENIFPFYKDFYHMKRMACQLLTDSSAFEEAYPEPNSRFLPPLPQVYFVKRLAVSDFVNQIKIQITMCDTPPSDYMTNPDHYLKRALGNEYDNVVMPLATAPTANYSNGKLIINQGEEMALQKNKLIRPLGRIIILSQNDDFEIVEEVTREPTYNEPLITSTTVESSYRTSYRMTFDKPPLSNPILASIVLAYSDKNGLTCPAICELMWKRFPFYDDQKDTLPIRFYTILKKSRFFVQLFEGGLPFSLFYLNTGNEEAMDSLKKEFRKFLFLNPEYLCRYIANPHELADIARKILGTNFDCDLAQNFQRLFNYISQIQMQ